MAEIGSITHFYNTWSFLSNFAASAIVIGGKTYATVEHYYQSKKTLDPDMAEEIRMARGAGQAKKLGQKAVLRPDWDEIKDDVMLHALRAKFKDPYMREHLLETGDALLVEGNTWHDQYWGDCNCKNRDGRHPECLSAGDNMLGTLLMQVRSEIAREDQSMAVWSPRDVARNITNQLFDLAQVPTDKRQAINDEADDFVEALLLDWRASTGG